MTRCIVLSGLSGLNRRDCAARIVNHLASKSIYTRQYVLEDFLDLKAFLDSEEDHQTEQWDVAFQSMINEIVADKPAVALILMHMTFQRHGRTFSPVFWTTESHPPSSRLIASLRRLNRNGIELLGFASLIDDIHQVWRDLRDRGYPFTLREILNWRDLETRVTDYVAREVYQGQNDYGFRSFPYFRCPIFSIRQSLNSFYRYFFEPSLPRIYLSFPISRPRVKRQFIEEYNRFRSFMDGVFAVFDPVAIDELPLLKKSSGLTGKTITLTAEDYWPLDSTGLICSLPRQEVQSIPASEIEELLTVPAGVENAIQFQVSVRDQRLIRQSDALVVYRPMFSGDGPRREDFSGGTRKEWEFAKSKSRTRILIHDRGNDGPYPEPPLSTVDNPVADRIDTHSPLSDPRVQTEALEAAAARVRDHTKMLIAFRRPRTMDSN